jgi:hypothetical protein
VARERVEQGTLILFKRFFGFPAYRCDPCRQKFFSFLPYRRIIPSMISGAARRISVS